MLLKVSICPSFNVCMDSWSEVPHSGTCCLLTLNQINHIGVGVGWIDGWLPVPGKIAALINWKMVRKPFHLWSHWRPGQSMSTSMLTQVTSLSRLEGNPQQRKVKKSQCLDQFKMGRSQLFLCPFHPRHTFMTPWLLISQYRTPHLLRRFHLQRRHYPQRLKMQQLRCHHCLQMWKMHPSHQLRMRKLWYYHHHQNIHSL